MARLDGRGRRNKITGSNVAEGIPRSSWKLEGKKAEIVDASGSAARKASKSVLPVEKG